MNQILSRGQILTILRGIEQVLRMLQAKAEYREIESFPEFSESNDFNIHDAISVLGEVQGGVESVEYARQSQALDSRNKDANNV